MTTRGKNSSHKTPRPRIQDVVSIPAPIGGLNARDALAAMPPTDAYGLVNWIPQQYGVRSRKGYAEWATGLAGPSVGTIMSWFGPATTIPTTANFQVAPTSLPGKVFAATDANIYDITTSGAAPAVSQALSGTTNAGSISSINFANSAGGWLLACSETDGYYTYDGATWVKVTLGGGATQVSVTDPTKFVAVAIWKRRAWFVTKSTAKAAYLPTDSIYGAGTELDLGPLLKHGGSLAWVSTWTIDAGEGIDDLLVFGSENGDIVVYKGTDPGSAATFTLIGVWYAGEVPKGRRGFTTLGGDLLIVSNLGLIPMSYITRGGANFLGTGTGNYTDKIQQLFGESISTTFNFFGWDLASVPRENLLILNTPTTIAGVYGQFVLNLTNNQWCQFLGMPMTCIKTVANWPLFGTADGRVMIAFTDYLDGTLLDGTGGQPISGLIQPAFNYFQKEGGISGNKHFLLVRPIFLSTVRPGYVLQMNVDFYPGVPTGIPLVGTNSGPVWDVSVWDQVQWSGISNTYRDWNGVDGVGFSGAIAIVTLVNVDTLLASIDYMMEPGGPM